MMILVVFQRDGKILICRSLSSCEMLFLPLASRVILAWRDGSMTLLFQLQMALEVREKV